MNRASHAWNFLGAIFCKSDNKALTYLAAIFCKVIIKQCGIANGRMYFEQDASMEERTLSQTRFWKNGP